jgi:Flp pilus assembly protein TadG
VQRVRRDDRGATGAVELMILLPILVLLIFGVVQMALCWHARNVVEATAEEASRVASAVDGSCAEAEARGVELSTRLGGSFLTGATSVACTGTVTVTVAVRSNALSILPGIRFPVRAETTAAAPKER